MRGNFRSMRPRYNGSLSYWVPVNSGQRKIKKTLGVLSVTTTKHADIFFFSFQLVSGTGIRKLCGGNRDRAQSGISATIMS
jgi:hypothetical protein